MYIPKNRIITNLYTNGGEFIYKEDKKPYSGFYWKKYSGEFYTGKTPNDIPNQELEIIHKTKNQEINTQSEITTNLNVSEYNKIIKFNSFYPKQIPQQCYPIPSTSDYELGVFSRYFVVKINENIYIELDEKTYSYINGHDNKWLWEIYIPFNLPWSLIGEENQVYQTNKNMVLLSEKRLNKIGFQEFLKNNYLKFYKYL